MEKKGIPEVLFRSVMSPCEGARTRVRVDFELPEEFEVNVGMQQGSVLSPFLFALVVDVVTEFAREGALSELLYADDLVLMSETIMGLRNKLRKWKVAFESKGLNVNLWKAKVMASSSITKDGLSKSNVGPCGFYSFRVKTNSVLCVNWIHGTCAREKMVTPMHSRNFASKEYEGNIGEALELEEQLCDEVKTVREFTLATLASNDFVV